MKVSVPEKVESLLNNALSSPPRPMARANISAMSPMTMIGKNFRGSSDRICAATASASESQRGTRAKRHSTENVNKRKLKMFVPLPSVQRRFQPKKVTLI